MIRTNLREGTEPYGVIVGNHMYQNHNITIIDNSAEVMNGRFQRNEITALIHMSPKVRRYASFLLYYTYVYSLPQNLKYRYIKQDLTTEEIVDTLKEVLYKLEPALQSHSLVGTTKEGIENDPNYYAGRYMLNDEEMYTILKCGTAFKFYKGEKRYYPDWEGEEDLLYKGDIDFDVYELALEVNDLKRRLVLHTNEVLEEDPHLFNDYLQAKDKLNTLYAERIAKP